MQSSKTRGKSSFGIQLKREENDTYFSRYPLYKLFPIPRTNDKLSRTSQIFPLRILRVKPNATPPETGKDTPPRGGREQVSPNSNKVGKLRRVVKDERLSAKMRRGLVTLV